METKKKVSKFVSCNFRIASELGARLPDANDEELYQKTRRIVVAEMQNVVYGQWLREILGPQLYQTHVLDPQADSFYKPEKMPTITNAFATAAFRFGHTLLEGDMTTFRLRDTFFNSTIYDQSFETILNSMQFQQAQSFDAQITADVREGLFQNFERWGTFLY